MDRRIIDHAVYGVALLLVVGGLVLYTMAIVPEALYRLGLQPVTSLPPGLVDVINDLSPFQNLAFYSGYVVGVAGLVALVLRKSIALYLVLAGAGLQLLDWALLPLAGQGAAEGSGLIDLGVPLLVGLALIYLRHVGFLK